MFPGDDRPPGHTRLRRSAPVLPGPGGPSSCASRQAIPTGLSAPPGAGGPPLGSRGVTRPSASGGPQPSPARAASGGGARGVWAESEAWSGERPHGALAIIVRGMSAWREARSSARCVPPGHHAMRPGALTTACSAACLVCGGRQPGPTCACGGKPGRGTQRRAGRCRVTGPGRRPAARWPRAPQARRGQPGACGAPLCAVRRTRERPGRPHLSGPGTPAAALASRAGAGPAGDAVASAPRPRPVASPAPPCCCRRGRLGAIAPGSDAPHARSTRQGDRPLGACAGGRLPAGRGSRPCART